MINGRISPSEFGGMIFLSSVFFINTITGEALNDNFSDSVWSCVLAFAIGAALTIPMLVYYADAGSEKETIKNNYPIIAMVVRVLYIIFFLYSCIWDLTSMISLMRNTLFSEYSGWILAVVIIAAALYGCSKKIESMGRAALIMSAVVLACSALLGFGVIQNINMDNLRIPFYDGANDFVKNTFTIFARATVLPQTFVIFRTVKRSKNWKSTYFLWYCMAGVIASASLFSVMLCLGSYGSTQQFPTFTLSTIFGLDPLQRLDIIFGATGILSLVAKLAMSLSALLSTVVGASNKKIGNLVLYGAAIIVAVSAVYLDGNSYIKNTIFSVPVFFILSVVLGAVVPEILCVVRKISAHEKLQKT